MKRCPFCGEKIAPDSSACKHCGKSLNGDAMGSDDAKKLSNLESWSDRSVPSWVMYLFVAFGLFFVWVMFNEGCSRSNTPDQKSEENETTSLSIEASPLASLFPNNVLTNNKTMTQQWIVRLEMNRS